MIKGVKNQVGPKDKSMGYTIVETMIFLIISGVLLATSLLFFRGRQQRTQFTQGVREIEANIKTIMGEVTSGYYPNNGTSFSCTASDSDSVPSLTFPGSTSTEQGENESCIFIGKVLNFDSSDKYSSYTVIGRRKAYPSGQIVSTLEEAKPTINDKVLETYNLPWGIRATKVVSVKGTPNQNRSAVGFIMSLGGNSSGDVISGAQTADLLPLGNNFAEHFDELQNRVEVMTDNDRRPDKVIICLDSGGRKGAIVLGGGGKQMSAESFIDSAVPGECS